MTLQWDNNFIDVTHAINFNSIKQQDGGWWACC